MLRYTEPLKNVDEDECECPANVFLNKFKTNVENVLHHSDNISKDDSGERLSHSKKPKIVRTKKVERDKKSSEVKVSGEEQDETKDVAKTQDYYQKEEKIETVQETFLLEKIDSNKSSRRSKEELVKTIDPQRSEQSKGLDQLKGPDKLQVKEKLIVSKKDKSDITDKTDKIDKTVEETEVEDEAKQTDFSEKSTDIEDKSAVVTTFQDPGSYTETESTTYYSNLEMAFTSKLGDIFGEDEEFPRSEKGYFIFDRSDQTVQKLSTIFTRTEQEDEEEYYVEKPPEEPWMSESEKKANEYLKNHKIPELFKFLGAHLISSNSCNPIDFLINLLDNCLNYRRGFGSPPLLFFPKHIKSLFDSMDPMKTGTITIDQYHTGMFTLGITDYNRLPEVNKNNLISKKIFVSEALTQLLIQLNEMIQGHKESFNPSISSFVFSGEA